MTNGRRACLAFTAGAAALLAISGVFAQSADPNAAPNPYKMEDGWAKLPDGRKMGAPIGVEVDRDGKSVWVFDRCGANDCGKSNVAPIMKFDPTGKLVTSFGGGMFNFPHGLGVDREGNVYVTDERGKNGKGAVLVKFSPEGKVLLTIGKPGMPGDGNDTLDGPSDVVVAPNGDIFVADGHGGNSNDRIVKFSKDGKFIKTWGSKGTGPGEFDGPHAIAMDSQGRLFVGDRNNNRIQIFDQDGKFIAQWPQFSRPSGVFIDKNDVIYVADSESESVSKNHFKQGIRIGSAKDGNVTAFIPAPSAEIGTPESITVDDQGIVYAGYTNKMALRRFVKN
jgi:sugar lactone lactonase YvrE